MPFYPFWGEGSPTKIDYRKEGALILTSLLEDLGALAGDLKSPSSSAGIFAESTGIDGSKDCLWMPSDAGGASNG